MWNGIVAITGNVGHVPPRGDSPDLSLRVHDSEQPARRMPGGNLNMSQSRGGDNSQENRIVPIALSAPRCKTVCADSQLGTAMTSRHK